MTLTPQGFGPAQADLRRLLNDWDPIGVASLVDDEYDCLLAPLWRRLVSGATQASMSEYLRRRLEDHFGLDPGHHDPDGFAERLVAWVGVVLPRPDDECPADPSTPGSDAP